MSQPDQAVQVPPAVPEREPSYDADCKPLDYPKVFVVSKNKLGHLAYTQLGGSKVTRSKYFASSRYDVMTTDISGVAGERIDVFRHIPLSGDTLYVTEADSILLTVGVVGSWYDRLLDDYLVVTLTTGPGPEGLWIFDILKRKLTCSLTKDGMSWDGFLLTFWEPIDSVVTTENCPESKKWIADGFDAAFEEACTVDIRTGEKRRLQKFRCVQTQ